MRCISWAFPCAKLQSYETTKVFDEFLPLHCRAAHDHVSRKSVRPDACHAKRRHCARAFELDHAAGSSQYDGTIGHHEAAARTQLALGCDERGELRRGKSQSLPRSAGSPHFEKRAEGHYR